MTSHKEIDDPSSGLDSALEIAFGHDSRQDLRQDEVGDLHTESVPERIGRYQIERLLGTGAFGKVYLGHDESLNRSVAIKVPHRRFVSNHDAYLAEARNLAMLDHPNIVPIYDVGSTEEWPCFIVSKFADGSLAQHLREHRLSRTDAAKLTASVADALHHAHKQHLVHRDIKPSNLLLDKSGQVYVADFGIALHNGENQESNQHVGTPGYISPEQARGEGHRVDGRSDVFSLGVVLYEMILGQRPFRAKRKRDLVKLAIAADPQPPRQLDETIPRELERICLKAMSRRAQDRYTTAHDLADDLRQFLVDHESSMPPPRRTTDGSLTPTSDSSPSTDKATSDVEQVARVVPKGLRAFDRHDADFFLQLLPGPRDRHGTPESIRFWQTKVEEVDADQTFSVGLIYGPSGCGKSSFLKAGLLPKLSAKVVVVHIEASASDTENRLLSALQRQFPWLPVSHDLKDTMIALRTADRSPDRQALIVIDQFEQWLHTTEQGEATRLSDALRHCDGGRLQCLLLVRDDFWMAITRFFRQLEVRLLDGHNAAAIDLFPSKHARKILESFGRSFGELPAGANEPIAAEQKKFLRMAVESLAQDGKVMPVRLALFADMMKDKRWAPATLQRVGGSEGLGVRFLEDQFGDANASPTHRYHQAGARAVLQALVPTLGESSIKGRMCSYQQLQDIAGYNNRDEDFEELIGLLDGQLRLITPVDQLGLIHPTGDDLPVAECDNPSVAELAESFDSVDGAPKILVTSATAKSNQASTSLPPKHYQLTHDYLVRPIREWLNQKQKETMRGRAELCLSEHSELWHATAHSRYLPGWMELFRIHLFTRRRNWSVAERRLIQKANAYYGLRGVMAMLVVGVLAVVGFVVRSNVKQHQLTIQRENESRNAKTLVTNMFASPPHAIRHALTTIEPLSEHALPLLRDKFGNRSSDRNTRLIAALGLSEFGEVQTEFLVAEVETAPASHRHSLVQALELERTGAVQELLRVFHVTEDLVYRSKLATLLLHFREPGPARSMLENTSSDPEARTRLIDIFPTWCVGLAGLDELLETANSNEFISGLCCALAELATDELSKDEQSQFELGLVRMWIENDDPGVHSAVGLLLRRWGMVEPTLSPENRVAREQRLEREMQEILAAEHVDEQTHWRAWSPPVDGQRLANVMQRGKKWKAWYLNSLGMTMIRLRSESIQEAPSFSVSDREVSVGQFHAWLSDSKIDDWPSHDHSTSPTHKHPMQNVTYGQALRFCNWLSEKEGLTPCYTWTDNEWKADILSGGYQVTRSGEWTVTCAASTDTSFASGKDLHDARRYAHFHSGNALKCGDKLPNAWGFFDLHGNVSEWCTANWKLGQSSESETWRLVRGQDFETSRPLGTRKFDAAPENSASNLRGFRVSRLHPASKQDPPGRPTDKDSVEYITYLEDSFDAYDYYIPLVQNLEAYARRSLAIAPNLASYTSIDRTLEISPGTLRWGVSEEKRKRGRLQQPIDYEARVAPFLEFARKPSNANPDLSKRVRYTQARLAQLAGKPEDAISVFEKLALQHPPRPEPLMRWIECKMAMNTPDAITELEKSVERFPNYVELWNLYVSESLNRFGRTPEELLKAMKAMPAAVRERRYYRDIQLLLELLQRGKPLHINCGAFGDVVVGATTWYHDRFFYGGVVDDGVAFELEIIGAEDPTIYHSVHSFYEETGGSYRLPLPNGAYAVTLMFWEGRKGDRDRIFDVAIEYETVLKDFLPIDAGFSVAHEKHFETIVSDGQLDIDFLPYADSNGEICGLRIERLTKEVADSGTSRDSQTEAKK